MEYWKIWKIFAKNNQLLTSEDIHLLLDFNILNFDILNSNILNFDILNFNIFLESKCMSVQQYYFLF